MVTTLPRIDKDSQEAFVNLLAGRVPEPIKPKGLEILRPGTAKGKLAGGNLTNLVHLIGTPYEAELTGTVLLLEEVGEAPYRIDRLLTHLKTAGRLALPAGIILGDFIDCEAAELTWNRVLELVADTTIPVWANFPAGHGKRNQILPLGAEVEMDSSRGSLTVSEQLFY
jgi:muramoyltetrapeptide carboxypeptidase